MSGGQLFDDALRQEEPAHVRHPEHGAHDVRAATTRRAALWAAYGDALGWISELTDAAGVRRRTKGKPLHSPIAWKRHIGGRGGVNALLPQGCYSDDTQLRIATSRAIGSNGFDVEAFAKVELPVWLGYALGGGNSTKAAAANLTKASTSWFANTYRGWLDSGGNGAAMRIQPHVWAAPRLDDPSAFLIDVVRNTVCTHAHPVGLMGAVLHALTLAHTMTTGATPDADMLVKLADSTAELPSLLREDAELGQYWLITWERVSSRAFGGAWKQTIQDTIDAVTAAKAASDAGAGAERYTNVIDALDLRDPGRRGSGQLCAIAAVALTWCEQQPADALAIAANELGSDTDTIATMAGALFGSVVDLEPPVEVLDADLIRSEADRLVGLAAGQPSLGHRYPDLLSWSPPRTQADALVTTSGGSLYVLGLGAVKQTIGDAMPAQQGEFLWQWLVLGVGQTLLIKRRAELATIHAPQPPLGQTEPTSTSRPKERTDMSVLEHPRRTDESQAASRQDQRTGRDRASGHTPTGDQPTRPLDLARVIAYIEKERDNDAAIGYAVRRLAREGNAEQQAAFLAVLLDLMRR